MSAPRSPSERFQYAPDTLRVREGARVVWSNGDEIEHTITSGRAEQPDGHFNGVVATRGATYAVTLEKATLRMHRTALFTLAALVASVNVSGASLVLDTDTAHVHGGTSVSIPAAELRARLNTRAHAEGRRRRTGHGRPEEGVRRAALGRDSHGDRHRFVTTSMTPPGWPDPHFNWDSDALKYRTSAIDDDGICRRLSTGP